MKLNILKLTTSILLICLCNIVSAQVAGTNNTLGATGITAIQSSTSAAYKLSIGGATKIFGTGAAGALASPSLMLINTGGGKKFGLYSSTVNGGQFQIFDSAATSRVFFSIDSNGRAGIGSGTNTLGNRFVISNPIVSNTAGLRFTQLTSASTAILTNGKQLSVDVNGDVILTADSLGMIQAPNRILAGPASGTTSLNPTFRSLFPLDIPNLDMAKITTGNLPLTRIGSIATAKLLGRFNAGAGTVEEISLGAGLTLTSGVLAASGGSMVYPASGIAVSTGAAWGTSITNNSANWDNAFTDRLKWDGGATGLDPANGRTSLGASLVGSSIFTLTNPSAIRYLQINANNTVSALDAASFRTAIGVQWTTTGNDISNNNTGNVGIGISNPTYKLDVTGNLRATLDANINGLAVGKGTNNIANNSAYGINALNVATGNQNTAIGSGSGSGITTGVANTAVGYATMLNTTGAGSTALGTFALQNWISGNYNVAIGYDAMHGSGTGSGNIGIGRNVMLGAVSGSYNVGLGHSALQSVTAGNNNVGLGGGAANNLTTGSDNIIIGYNVLASSPGVSNELNIGNWIYGSSGNIGIAKATPTEKLDVNGNIYTNGKILINQANNAAAAPYALAVNGSAIFTKAVVKLNANWPDYVFEPTYKLPSLQELEEYIQKNKHLPNVPNAEQVKKDGIDLGNTQTIQMQKIEELTLYIIELNKKIEALQKDNTEIKKQLSKEEPKK